MHASSSRARGPAPGSPARRHRAPHPAAAAGRARSSAERSTDRGARPSPSAVQELTLWPSAAYSASLASLVAVIVLTAKTVSNETGSDLHPLSVIRHQDQ